MRQVRVLMGMPVSIEIVEQQPTGAPDSRWPSALNPERQLSISAAIEKAYEYLDYVDRKFSTYNPESEISAINAGKLEIPYSSADMQEVFRLSEKTKDETDGYFDIVNRDGKYDPSGLVKGWAIFEAAKVIEKLGFKDYFVEAGGDIQVSGRNAEGGKWKVGIQNPFNQSEIVKTVALTTEGIATSGSYVRGHHIYNPKNKSEQLAEVVSLTVIGPNIYEADRFATAAFAMGKEGINFIEKLPGFEGYQIDVNGTATMTTGFEKFVEK